MSQWREPEYWLRECVNSHAVCRIPSPHFVPRRLLHVTDDEQGLHLVERVNLNQDSKSYCALSYCWGSASDTLTTRKENLDQHFKGMSLSALPQTIHDAIIVCRSLSIPYLWVDALCIVQNDDGERDWYEQSSEMCEIYSNAHLVISVDAAPSANFGFLPGRDHGEKQWESIHLHDTANRRQLIASMRAHKCNTSVSYDGRSWDGVSIKPLLSRGWALQESLLANRLLRFTTHGMRWECNHIHQDQMGLMSRVIRLSKLIRLYPTLKSGLPRNELQALYAEEELHTRHITDFMKQNTRTTIYHAWQGIVSHYSERSLTKITDKLSALSGLARFVSEALDAGSEDYLAGHWRGDLASSLLWYVGPSRNSVNTVTYRAPTWSWASIDGQIQYFYEQYQFQFKSDLVINSATCYSYPIDRFGRVTSGKICVTGLTVPVSLYISPTKSHPVQYLGGNGNAAHAHTNQFSWVTSDQQNEDRVGCSYYEVLLDRRMLVEYLASRNFKCLLVGDHRDTLTGGQRTWWLVLRQSLAAEDCWERVGIGYFQEYSKTLELFCQNSAIRETIMLV